MTRVKLYTKHNCPLCDDAMGMLTLLQADYQFDIEERDIYTRNDWLHNYQLLIPVVEVSGRQIDCESMNFDELNQLFEETIQKR